MRADSFPSKEAWDQYKKERGFDNISKAKIIRRLRKSKVYAEVLLEIQQSQPIRITEIVQSLNYGRDWVTKIIKWMEQARLFKAINPSESPQLGEEDYHKIICQKIAKLRQEKRLVGAAYQTITQANFYVLTLRGEEFIPVAAEALGLNKRQNNEIAREFK